MIFRKADGPLEEQMEGKIVCDSTVWVRCQLIDSFCDRSQYSLDDKTHGEGIQENGVSVGRSVLRLIRGIQRQPLSACAVFQVPIAQKNSYVIEENFSEAYSTTLRIRKQMVRHITKIFLKSVLVNDLLGHRRKKKVVLS